MTKFLKTLAISACVAAVGLPVQAEIISTAKLQDVQTKVEQQLQRTPAEATLVVFDADHTLTLPGSAAVYVANIKKYMDPFDKLMGDLAVSQKDLALALANQTGNLRLVDPEAPKVLKALQDKSVPVIAFSTTLTGPLGESKPLEAKLSEKLQNVGLTFGKAIKQGDSTFSDIPAYNLHHPVYYSGVLCANGEYRKESRQSTIVAFLKERTSQPKVFVMVDSNKQTLKDVESALKIYSPTIEFVGIEYTASAPWAIAQTEFVNFWKGIVDQVKTMKDKALDTAANIKDKTVEAAATAKDTTVEAAASAKDKAIEVKDAALTKTSAALSAASAKVDSWKSDSDNSDKDSEEENAEEAHEDQGEGQS